MQDYETLTCIYSDAQNNLVDNVTEVTHVQVIEGYQGIDRDTVDYLRAASNKRW